MQYKHYWYLGQPDEVYRYAIIKGNLHAYTESSYIGPNDGITLADFIGATYIGSGVDWKGKLTDKQKMDAQKRSISGEKTRTKREAIVENTEPDKVYDEKTGKEVKLYWYSKKGGSPLGYAVIKGKVHAYSESAGFDDIGDGYAWAEAHGACYLDTGIDCTAELTETDKLDAIRRSNMKTVIAKKIVQAEAYIKKNLVRFNVKQLINGSVSYYSYHRKYDPQTGVFTKPIDIYAQQALLGRLVII
jgi:hypothetical protein